MQMVCLDLEGVLVPEIWIGIAEQTGIDGFRKTTRDVADYNVLMEERLRLLRKHGLGMERIRDVIATLAPLEGARDFLDSLREGCQVTVLSDTFYEFAEPLMVQLGRPALFCHHLEVGQGEVNGWVCRVDEHKRRAVLAFRQLGFRVVAVGDSYNDLGMLDAAGTGILFRAPDRLLGERPDLPALTTYEDLASRIRDEAGAEGHPR